MRKPFVIFRISNRSALKSCALLLVCVLLLALSVGLYRFQKEAQGSAEVFAGEDRPKVRPQGLYALMEQLFEDE